MTRALSVRQRVTLAVYVGSVALTTALVLLALELLWMLAGGEP